MSLEIREFDVNRATREEWDELNAYRTNYFKENLQGFPFIEDKYFEKHFTTGMNQPDEIHRFFRIYLNNKLIGRYVIFIFKENSPNYEKNEKNLMFSIEITKANRRKGFTSLILPKIADLAHQYKKEMLISNFVHEEDGKNFLKHIKPNFELNGKFNQLAIKDVNWKVINTWIEEGAKINPTLKLIVVTKIPEEYLESFCKVYTFGWNQAPRASASGDMALTPEDCRKKEERNKKNFVTTETAMVIDSAGTVIGMTEIYSIGGIKNSLGQNLTTVVEEYRHRKIGKWLKGTLLKHVMEKYPTTTHINTANATMNAPILAINTQMGYKTEKEWIHWQISVQELENYIEKSNEINKNPLVIEQ